MKNLAVQVFMVLRNSFFDDKGEPLRFDLREKLNTQDDPFDEYIATLLDNNLKKQGIRCQKSTGPLISPDMAVFDDSDTIVIEKLINNPETIIGIEVKKLERAKNGSVARHTGLDYNSTPPCGKIRIYSSDNKPLEIKGFYLFACLEQDKNKKYYVSAMSLCDGSILNDDFDLYMSITGSREKGINIGTYGDGANRNRPMLIFSNPLGSKLLDHRISYISDIDHNNDYETIALAWRFVRKDKGGSDHIFYAYLDRRDLPDDHTVDDVQEPFPTPSNRVNKTQGRGKFILSKYYEELNAICKKKHDN